jgi:Fe-S cluster biogenesis protein NfuA
MAKSAKRKRSETVATAADRSAKVLTDGSANVTEHDIARRADDLDLACDRKRERIEIALNRIRPRLQADGVDVELVEVRGNGASVRLTGLCVQCGAGLLNFHTGLEQMLREDIEEFGDLRLTTTSGTSP